MELLLPSHTIAHCPLHIHTPNNASLNPSPQASPPPLLARQSHSPRPRPLPSTLLSSSRPWRRQYLPLTRPSSSSSPSKFVCSSCNGPSSSSSSSRHWDDDDDHYVQAHVLEAVSLLPSQGHLFMTLANGREIEVDHVNPAKGRLIYRSRNPTMFLKIDCDDSDLFLPIVVGEVAIVLLMKALHGDEKTSFSQERPNQYRLMKELAASLNYEVRMVRVTERVVDTYYARIYLGKPGEEEMESVDARPSDAINLAVRCKVPIYVNKAIVAADAVRPVQTVGRASGILVENPWRIVDSLDSPENGPDPIAEEITLMKNILLAVVEERYNDAARWRDELNNLRASKWHIRQI